MRLRTLGAAAALGIAAISSAARGAILINEVDSDSPNTPSTDFAEFVELYDSSAGSVSLNGYVLVLYNGNGNRAYGVFDLDGFSTTSSGFFLAGTSAIPGAQLITTANSLQNGVDAVALYLGNSSDFTTGATGTLATDPPPAGTTLIDAVVYKTGADVDGVGLDTALLVSGGVVDEFGPSQSATFGANNSIGRISNGSGAARSTLTYTNTVPTPGATNVAVPEPTSIGLALIGGALVVRRPRRRD